jgi:MFS family permease
MFISCLFLSNESNPHTIGIVLGFSAGLILGDNSWQYMFLLGRILPTIMIVLVVYIMPETPRWLITLQRIEMPMPRQFSWKCIQKVCLLGKEKWEWYIIWRWYVVYSILFASLWECALGAASIEMVSTWLLNNEHVSYLCSLCIHAYFQCPLAAYTHYDRLWCGSSGSVTLVAIMQLLVGYLDDHACRETFPS